LSQKAIHPMGVCPTEVPLVWGKVIFIKRGAATEALHLKGETAVITGFGG
jgi:hypothetical protein